jgi:hypothetical protein
MTDSEIIELIREIARLRTIIKQLRAEIYRNERRKSFNK